MLIFLADTVHHATQLNPNTVPYNVARIAAYAQSQFPDCDYRLFKDPKALLDELRADRPAVLALSNYFWNTQLNHRIARYARTLYPDLIIVTGGPNLDRDEGAYVRYSITHPYVDFVIVEEGETAFVNVLRAISSLRLAEAKATDVPGTIAIRGAGDVQVSSSLTRKNSLDEFPSPYLNGMLDPFLSQGLRPILETVRGCPYRCAFCEQGSDFFTKIATLSEARVYAEIEYIRARTSSPQLILADVNFGILKRDLDVAEFLKRSHVQNGWPKSLYVYNAKQPTETTLRTMETLYPMAQLCMSFQSTDEDVLKNIHRANIGYDKYSFITRWAKARNIPVGTELIFGLPGESRQSFVEGCEALLNFQADYMASYNLRLFPGIELNTPAKRKEFSVDTRYRLMDINLGEYQFESPERIVEVEEIVFQTSTLDDEDYFFSRRLGFLIETLWNTGYVRPALAFLANHGLKVTATLQALLNDHSLPAAARAFFGEYDLLSRNELATSEIEFSNRIKDEEYWHDLVSGRGNNFKLNLAFAGRLLLFSNEFDEFFYEFLAERYAGLLPAEHRHAFVDVLTHCRSSKVDLDHPEPRSARLSFDVPGWVRATYPKDITPFKLPAPITYHYAIDRDTFDMATRIRHDLAKQGARMNNVAERLIMELPPMHRSARLALRSEGLVKGELPAELGQRVSWSG